MRHLAPTFLFCSLITVATGARAQSLEPLLAIENPEPPTAAGDDRFGASIVQIDAARLAAGAPFDDPLGPATGVPVSNAGSVYVIGRLRGELVRRIQNPNGKADDGFGSSVALADLDAGQKLLVIGSPGFDSSPHFDVGAVYVTGVEGGVPSLRLNIPTPRIGARFGQVVRASGSYVLIGDPLNDVLHVSDAGSVYLYRLERRADTGELAALLIRMIDNPFPYKGDRFGASIALGATGGEPDVIVGTPDYNSSQAPDAGRVYVFRGRTLQLTLQPPLTDMQAQSRFGAAVTARGSEIIVGAPGFDEPGAKNAGRIYVFDGTANGGTPGARYPFAVIANPDLESGAFGTVVTTIGSTLVGAGAPHASVGAHARAGKVYIYNQWHGLSTIIANPAPGANDRFGSELADGSADLLIGAPFDEHASGVIFSYSTAGALLLTVPNPEAPTLLTSADSFGASIAAMHRGTNDPRGSGTDLAIGAPFDDSFGITDSGAAYVVDGDNGQLLTVIHNPAPVTGAFFGWAVGSVDRPASDSRGGQDLLVGSMRNAVYREHTIVESVEPGAAYLYDADRRGDASEPDIVLFHPEMASDAGDLEHYGAQVLGAGDKIIVGSMFGNDRQSDDTGREGYGVTRVDNTGAVFLIDRSDPENPYPAVIQDPSPRMMNQFGGNSIQAIAPVVRDPNDPRGPGFDLLIGASLYDDDPNVDAGRAYLFDGVTRDLLLVIDSPAPKARALFGAAVAAMGTNLVIGAPGDFYPGSIFRSGSVYVYDGTRRGETSSPVLTIVKQFPNLSTGQGDRFGASLTTIGNAIFVGAPADSDPDGPGGIAEAAGAGAVFVFDGRLRNSPGYPAPTPLAILSNPDEHDLPSPAQSKSNDAFGTFLTSMGGRLAVGAPADDRENRNGTIDANAGAVYVYNWDTTPPVITSALPSIDALWPPNNQMLPVTIVVSVTDNVDPAPVCSILRVASNEPIRGLGNGDREPDWQFSSESLVVNLRAERRGKGTGRTYTITIACADSSKNTSTTTASVTVPHDAEK